MKHEENSFFLSKTPSLLTQTLVLKMKKIDTADMRFLHDNKSVCLEQVWSDLDFTVKFTLSTVFNQVLHLFLVF